MAMEWPSLWVSSGKFNTYIYVCMHMHTHTPNSRISRPFLWPTFARLCQYCLLFRTQKFVNWAPLCVYVLFTWCYTGGWLPDQEPSFDQCLLGSVNTACCFKHKVFDYSNWALPLLSTFCLPDVTYIVHVTRSPKLFSSVFTQILEAAKDSVTRHGNLFCPPAN